MQSILLKGLPRLGLGLPIAGLVCAAALLAFPAMFSTMAAYDDEGYVMMTLRTYIQGERLYGKTYTQYGPAYYLITAPIHSWMGLPLTQDAVRLKSIVVWIIVSFIAFAIGYRTTRSRVFAFFLGLVCAMQLQKLSLEPGHPQEVTLLATLMILLSLTFFPRPTSSSICNNSTYLHSPKGKHSSSSCWIIATIVASFFACVAGWTKLNCGIVVAIPLIVCTLHYSLPISTITKRRHIWRFVQWSSLAMIALPGLLILWNSRSDVGGSLWALSGTSAAVAFVYQSFQSRKEITSCQKNLKALDQSYVATNSFRSEGFLREMVGFILPVSLLVFVALITSATIVGLVLLQGVTPSELWYGMIGQHQTFSHHFYQPLRLTMWSGADLMLAILVCVAVVVVLCRRGAQTSILRSGFFVFCFAVFGFANSSMFYPLRHGLEPYAAGYLLALLGPWVIFWFMPLHVVSTKDANQKEFAIDRFSIAITGIISPWIAFPVAGTQVELGTIPTLIAIGICLWDEGKARYHSNSQILIGQYRKEYLSVCCIGLLLFALGVNSRWAAYLGATPLPLPGSSLIRLSQDRVDEEVGIVQEILRVANSTSPPMRNLCFEGHNNNRFYFWTGLSPLTSINPTFWPRMITDQQESEILAAMKSGGGVCVVRVPNFKKLVGNSIPAVTNCIESRFSEVICDRQSGKGWSSGDRWEIGCLVEPRIAIPVNQTLTHEK